MLSIPSVAGKFNNVSELGHCDETIMRGGRVYYARKGKRHFVHVDCQIRRSCGISQTRWKGKNRLKEFVVLKVVPPRW